MLILVQIAAFACLPDPKWSLRLASRPELLIKPDPGYARHALLCACAWGQERTMVLVGVAGPPVCPDQTDGRWHSSRVRGPPLPRLRTPASNDGTILTGSEIESEN